MSHTQQSSIRAFFQPRRHPEYAAPPSSAPLRNNIAASTTAPAPPPAPPPPATAVKPAAVHSITLPPNGVPVLPSPPSLPSGATIVPLAEQHIPALRRINSLLLPVPYPDSFYARALDPYASGLFSRAILWQDSDTDTPKLVGGLICRLEPNLFLDAQGQPISRPSLPSHSQKPTSTPCTTPYHAIYIQSLALLSPYRSLGLAAAALEHIAASAALLPAAGSSIDARTIYAHVWTENEEGLKWYEARGFAREGREPVKGYYFKLRPDTAWVVRRHIGLGDGSENPPLANNSSSSSNNDSTFTPISASGTATPPSTTDRLAATAPAGTRPANVLAAAINLLPPPLASQPSAPPQRRPSAAPSPSPAPSSASSTSLSFQKARPETEWNDLPADMVSASNKSSSQSQLHPPPPGGGRSAGPASGASSRSSSTARKKKERAYPSAAFGGQ
ncbi:hypothetical protein N658DRAFT_468543 [Parathielavia hyrcaniae]|uniref:N-acetyltransferase domain-containing protein n=1 Tax=Parathielavia hyrcaniae TaxID=113614 RepID=A0AAN6T2P7_9PEZI|nr:hypothetical protein N658DRAFT_468543 [Parathielavia hyrcaniae]